LLQDDLERAVIASALNLRWQNLAQ
jgi:hypothetical protein